MRRFKPAGVGIAVIRTVVEPGPRPVIRILEITDLNRGANKLVVTTSVDEAAKVITAWLNDVIAHGSGGTTSPAAAP